MAEIVVLKRRSPHIDVNREFRGYKYAVTERPATRLSTGEWLHVYRVTRYDDACPCGDMDVEQGLYENELYG